MFFTLNKHKRNKHTRKKMRFEQAYWDLRESMDKFVTSIKKNTIENLGENITNKQETYQKELEDNEIIQQKENNENSPNNIQISDKKTPFKIFT